MKILYFSNKPSKIKNLLPYHKISFKLEDLYSKKFDVIIFDKDSLFKGLNLNLLKDKICLINFKKEDKKDIKLVKKYNFFDYLTEDDDKELVLFKLNRISKFLSSKHTIIHRDRKIQKMIMVDTLTGAYNWRYFISRAEQELSRAHRNFLNVSFIGIDIDNFRDINKLYGIEVADKIIQDIVKILKNNLRREDVITRWREDEFFIIILSSLERKDLEKIVNRIKQNITSNIFSYKNLQLKINISIGVVMYPNDNVFTSQDVINALESCFTDIKRSGGNNILFYSDRAVFEKTIIKRGFISQESKKLKERLNKLNTLLTRDMLDMIYGFAKIIEAKDSYTGRHIEDTALFAEKIARELNLSSSEIENVKHAAILHDLGKIGIDEKILSKKGPLTKEEKKVIMSHPIIAVEILKGIHSLRREILSAILYHHEHYDGSGYPFGLKDKEIPLLAKIVGLADVYQALISNRPYRRALSKKKAIEIIKKESGKQFDPKVVEAFLKVVER